MDRGENENVQESPAFKEGGAVAVVFKRKRKPKKAVPEDQKDDKFHEKRRKNTIASQKSRVAKNLRQNGLEIKVLQTAIGHSQENKELKSKLEKAEIKLATAESRIAKLLERLAYYEDQESK